MKRQRTDETRPTSSEFQRRSSPQAAASSTRVAHRAVPDLQGRRPAAGGASAGPTGYKPGGDEGRGGELAPAVNCERGVSMLRHSPRVVVLPRQKHLRLSPGHERGDTRPWRRDSAADCHLLFHLFRHESAHGSDREERLAERKVVPGDRAKGELASADRNGSSRSHQGEARSRTGDVLEGL